RLANTVAMIGPGWSDGPPPLTALRKAAHRSGRRAFAWKLPPRDAAAARAMGWHVHRVGVEAIVETRAFDPLGPGGRQLRRKLKKAAAAGVEVARAEGPLPMAEMLRIDATWQAAHGGARGVTMGRTAPATLALQEVWTIRRNGQLVGFVSFHVAARERTLDLIRHAPGLPDGALHLAVATAIRTARTEGVARVSLAAVPDPAGPGWLTRPFARRAGSAGLRQFKASFAPRWQPVHAAAPDRLSLLLGALDLARAVNRPPTADPAPGHADIEGGRATAAFAPAPDPWQERRN
ncbi:DUF2156 domain-containing protein, partial [Oceaniglobus roseus]|uniref:DUF2156 domain-containing protein n=1 Tax=Oceaniglobus roseus TaxID=1737570 RepID=UPI001562C28D